MCKKNRNIPKGEIIQNRQVVSGYELLAGNQHYYLFIGEKIRFCYVEILSAERGAPVSGFPHLHEVELMGLEWPPRGAQNYLIKKFHPANIEDARQYMNEILRLFGLLPDN